MKRISKILLMLVLSVSIVYQFAACGKSDKIDKNGNITLKFWSIYPEGSAEYSWVNEKIDNFEKNNPKVDIVYTGISFWDYFTKIETSQVTPDGPDIYMQTITNNGFRASGGISMDISSYFTDDFNKTIFNPMDAEALSYNDGFYGISYATDGRFLYYNIDMLNELKQTSDADWINTKAGQKDNTTILGKPADLIDNDNNVRAPKTYDEIMAYSELLTIKNSNGDIERLGFDVNIGNNNVMNFVWNMGGEFFDENGKPVVTTNEGVRKGIETWKEISRINPVAQTNSFISSGAGTSDSINLFWTKKVAFMIATNEVPWQNDLLNDEKINLGVSNVPYTDEEYRCNFSGGFSMEISNRLVKEDKRVAQAAVDFLEYMVSDEVQTEVLTKTSNMPSKTSVTNQLAETINDPVKQFVLSEIEYRKPFDFIIDAPQWWGPVYKYLTEYVSGKKDLNDALSQMQKGIEKLQATN